MTKLAPLFSYINIDIQDTIGNLVKKCAKTQYDLMIL